jgi:hypothetical protein
MTRADPISEDIKKLEKRIAKYKAVHAAFPDARITSYEDFYSKTVNSTYTSYSFIRAYNGLYVCPFSEVAYTYDGQEEYVKVHSSPKSSKLVHLTWERTPTNKKIMRFARFAFNQKNHNFKEEMLNACKAEIMDFIKENPGYHLDTKHLEPRLKKLLLFI